MTTVLTVLLAAVALWSIPLVLLSVFGAVYLVEALLWRRDEHRLGERLEAERQARMDFELGLMLSDDWSVPHERRHG